MSNSKAAHAGPAVHKPLPSSPIPPPSSSKKRKHAIDTETRKKAVGRKRARKTVSLDDSDDLIANGLNHAFAKMDGPLLSDYVTQRVRRFGEDLSSVEIEDKYIPGRRYSVHAIRTYTCEPIPVCKPKVPHGLFTLVLLYVTNWAIRI